MVQCLVQWSSETEFSSQFVGAAQDGYKQFSTESLSKVNSLPCHCHNSTTEADITIKLYCLPV